MDGGQWDSVKFPNYGVKRYHVYKEYGLIFQIFAKIFNIELFTASTLRSSKTKLTADC